MQLFESWARQHTATGGDVTWVGRSLHDVFHVGHGPMSDASGGGKS
jgi:hypothetical protein